VVIASVVAVSTGTPRDYEAGCRDHRDIRPRRVRSGVSRLRGRVGDLAQGRHHVALGPVLRVQLGELLLVGDRRLHGVVLHDGPPADDLLGLGVRSVDPSDLALADHEVHGVLGAVQTATVEEDPLGGPDFTQVIREGRLAEKLAVLMASAYPELAIPQKTTITPIKENEGFSRLHPFQDRKRYLRAIVGLTDFCLFPLICPGALLIVDRECKTIPTYDFFNELERPKFLIETHDGLFCCWCDSQDEGRMIRVVQHPLGTLPHRSLHWPLKLGREAGIVGEVVFWGMESPKHRLSRRV